VSDVPDLRSMENAGRYQVVLADPPWRFKARTAVATDGARSAGAHYPTMDLAAIKALPVRDVLARDCHLFLWTTGPFLELSFDVLAAWGFRYSTIAFAWMKLRRGAGGLFYDHVNDLHFGGGYTTRSNVEICLLGRRGSPKRLSRAVRQAILGPVREHSRKPDVTRERIIAYADGPRLEMFARSRADGFDAWGNQVDKFEDAA